MFEFYFKFERMVVFSLLSPLPFPLEKANLRQKLVDQGVRIATTTLTWTMYTSSREAKTLVDGAVTHLLPYFRSLKDGN